MIAFKTFLNESRMAPLYHGTALQYLSSIINDNMLRAHTTQHMGTEKNRNDVRGTSLSRNYEFSRRWIDWEYGVVQRGVIIKINQQKLAASNKIIPYNFWNNHISVKNRNGELRPTRTADTKNQSMIGRNEYEEFVVGDVKKFNKYIEQLIFVNSSLDRFKKDYPTEYQKLQDWNISIVEKL